MKNPQMKFDLPESAPAVYCQRELTDGSPFPFGKYNGTQDMDVPLSYLNWFVQQDRSNAGRRWSLTWNNEKMKSRE